jgi:hypothetical protein
MILLLFLVFTLFQAEDIVTVDLRASTTTPRAGDPIELSLTVTLPPGYTLIEWPDFPSAWGDFEVNEVDERIETVTDGNRHLSQQITARLWRPGDYQTPETFVGYQTPAGELFRIPIRPVSFTVPSVVDRNDLTLRPDREPIGVFFVPLWLTVIVVVAAGAIGLYGRQRYLLWQPQRSLETTPPTLKPAQIADRDLSMLAPDEPEAATSILRDYLEAKFDVPSTSMTTEEILESVPVSERMVIHLREIFEYADLTRYANIEAQSSQTYIEMIRSWIAEADLGG